MGQSSDQIREEIDQHRHDAADKIDRLQSQVQGAADDLRSQAQDTVAGMQEQVKGTVDETIETVKQNLDFREQVQERPLVALGAALIGGFVVGGMLGGGSENRSSGHHVDSESTHTSHSSGGGMGSTVQHAVKSSGLEEMLSNAAAALMGSVTEQVKQTVDRNMPGFSQKMDEAKRTPGSVMEKSRQVS